MSLNAVSPPTKVKFFLCLHLCWLKTAASMLLPVSANSSTQQELSHRPDGDWNEWKPEPKSIGKKTLAQGQNELAYFHY